MNIDEIKSNSAELFEMAAAQANNTSETTPTTITPEIESFCKSFRAQTPAYVPVQPDKHGLYGYCNDGVAEKIKANGGKMQYGWTIWEYPRLFLTAEFHAVWLDAAGQPIDITPKPGGETQIVFSSDPAYPSDFDFNKRPSNQRTRIYKPRPSAPLIQARIDGFSSSQAAYETKRAAKNGMTLEQWVETKIPIDPLVDLIDNFLSDANEHDALFTLTSEGMECHDPARLMKVELKKMQGIHAIKKLLNK